MMLKEYKEDSKEYMRMYHSVENYRQPLGTKFLDTTFNDPFFRILNDEYITRAKDYIEGWCNSLTIKDLDYVKGFYLFSNLGRCKTSIASCVYNWFIDNSYPICAVISTRYLFELFDEDWGDNVNRLAYLERMPVLIVDDIGVDYITKGFTGEERNSNLKRFFDIRNDVGKITCFTSNYTFDGLVERGYSPQIVDRIREMTNGHQIRINGDSIRNGNDLQRIVEQAREEKARKRKEEEKNKPVNEMARKNIELAKELLSKMKREQPID